jgi:TPR repeat protein
VYDFGIANQEFAIMQMEDYYPCCGKSICEGCSYSSRKSGSNKCPFCNADRNKTEEERIQEMIRRVEANDAASICLLANFYYQGIGGFQQDHAKAIEHCVRAADLGFSKAHSNLAVYHQGGNMKKAKFHFEAAAMAGHEVARYNLGILEYNSGNMERAVKHWTIAASAGCYYAMHELRMFFEQGVVSRESIDSVLAAYNNSCADMRSEARDAYIQYAIDHNVTE